MKAESAFLSEIGMEISDALWSEPELGKKERMLSAVLDKISKRQMKLLPPDTPLMG